MSFTINKEFHFSASHQLKGLPDGHQCARLHGHNYTVYLQLQAEKLDVRGFVVDFGDLAPFKEHIDTLLDHRHLNDVIDLQPTAENIAKYLYGVAKALWPEQIYSVIVSETPSTWASYTE